MRGVRRVACSTMLEDGATHLGVATDHVIESFRNDLWPGYKTGDGIDPELLAQFPLLEEALEALGVAVWAMVELEADDALAAAAGDGRRRRPRRAGADLHARQGSRPVRAEASGSCSSTAASGGCSTRPACARSSASAPASIPDWLALVGDSADGFPGPAGLGREVGGGRARPLRAPRGDPGAGAPTGT